MTSGAAGRPAPFDVLLLVTAVVAVGTSAPLIAAIAAPALAVALWRNVLSVAVIGPYALARRRTRAELGGLSRRELSVSVVAGLFLAAHFATWVPSVRLTSVAASTALVAAQPVWAALIARARGEVISRQAWIGIGVSFAGVLVLTGVDVTVDAGVLLGDLLAILGGIFAAAYVTAGAVVRQTVTTTTYTLLCYSVCAAALLVVCLVARVDLAGYPASDWVKIVALTIGAQLLGHSVFNIVLRRISPVTVSLAILLEVPGAVIIAAIALGQLPPAAVVPAMVLLLVGLAIVVHAQAAQTPVLAEEAPL